MGMKKNKGTDDTTLRAFTVPAAPRDTARAHYLVVIAGTKAGQRMRLGDSPVEIGRSEPADWIVADPQVSRSHCRVGISRGEVWVADLDSSNGTYVDGRRIGGKTVLPVGARLQVGTHIFEHEWCTRADVEDAQAREHDVERAEQYIHALLPPPLDDGPVLCDWALEPSPRFGGDAFGYRMVDERHYAMYLLDVSGHGAGATMHAVSVLNLLYRGALPVTDYANPTKVLETLNVMFEMEAHGGLSFALWYGCYDRETRRLRFASAGHHPAFLVHASRNRAIPLATQAPVIGITPKFRFPTSAIDVPPKSMLYVFSDGAFEFATKDRNVWGLENFVAVMLKPRVPGKTESQRLLDEVRKHSAGDELEDDFALMALTFP